MKTAVQRAAGGLYRRGRQRLAAIAIILIAGFYLNTRFLVANDSNNDDAAASPRPASKSSVVSLAPVGVSGSEGGGVEGEESPAGGEESTKRAKTAAPPPEAEVIDRAEWIVTTKRGVTLDMYNLTQLNDCKRLPSWRANEKRFIRLQNDRQKARNCVGTAKLTHTQLFGVRTVMDTTPTSHLHYREYANERDTLDVKDPPPRLLRLAQRYVKEHHSALSEKDAEQEALRIFSLTQIVDSDAFQWKSPTPSELFAQQRHFNTLDDMIHSGRLKRSEDSNFSERLEINADELGECHFSERKALSHSDQDSFSIQGYHLVQFLFEESFLRHGWITIPIAGTALGTLRHHGMFRGDDDMDMTTYPPAKHLHLNSSWGDLYDDFETLVEEYGARHRSFSWFKSNDYRFHHAWYTRNDKKKKLPAYPFTEYEDHVRQDGRVCFAQYMTWNATEKRRLFQTEGCTPNHWFMCLQPSTYIYGRHDEVLERHVIQDVNGIFSENLTRLPDDFAAVGPMIFTAFHRRPAGKICKCKFGFKNENSQEPSFALCMNNLHDFVQYWYDGKWCVPSGAVRTRKWSFLKSWND